MSTVYNFADGYDASGKSTYDIWKGAGNTGEVSDFLAFIQLGAKGERGLQGEQGPDGESEYQLWERQEGNTGKTEEDFINRELDVIYMKDSVNGLIYFGKIIDNKLTFKIVPTIKVSKTPYTMNYIVGEKFDPTGMVIIFISEDGTKTEITDFTYDEFVTEDGTITISYSDDNGTYNTIIEINMISSMEEKLIDFTYTIDENGIYELQTWKGTLNGQPSATILVPSNPKIKI